MSQRRTLPSSSSVPSSSPSAAPSSPRAAYYYRHAHVGEHLIGSLLMLTLTLYITQTRPFVANSYPRILPTPRLFSTALAPNHAANSAPRPATTPQLPANSHLHREHCARPSNTPSRPIRRLHALRLPTRSATTPKSLLNTKRRGNQGNRMKANA